MSPAGIPSVTLGDDVISLKNRDNVLPGRTPSPREDFPSVAFGDNVARDDVARSSIQVVANSQEARYRTNIINI